MVIGYILCERLYHLKIIFFIEDKWTIYFISHLHIKKQTIKKTVTLFGEAFCLFELRNIPI